MTLEQALRGKYIAFDGVDGCGKSTQVHKLSLRLMQARSEIKEEGVSSSVVTVREPGGTEYGEEIRKLLLYSEIEAELSPYTEALLFMAARAQLVREKVKPLLDAGCTVISDRCAASTFAYQCGGSYLTWGSMMDIYAFAVPKLLRPDLMVIFTIEDREVARKRIEHKIKDRIEKHDRAFHDRVHYGYLDFRRIVGGNVIYIDAAGTIEEVFDTVLEKISEFFYC